VFERICVVSGQGEDWGRRSEVAPEGRGPLGGGRVDQSNGELVGWRRRQAHGAGLGYQSRGSQRFYVLATYRRRCDG